MRHIFTHEQLDFLRDHVVGRSKRDLTNLFNQHFGLDLPESKIVSCCKNHKFPPSGLDGRFKPGRTPFNKGKKGLNFGGKETQFKKGYTPKNYRPVGSERINADGYAEIKIADPNKWRMKHTVIWEKENGPLPKGYAVIFGDGDKANFNINNLLLVSRKQLLILNKKHLIKDDSELTKTGIIVADIYSKIGERKKAK